MSTFAGSWDITIATPIGEIAAVFDITERDGVISGVARSDAETVDFVDPVAEGNRLTWSQKVTTPMQLWKEISAGRCVTLFPTAQA